jgi:hypothetical protein
MSGWFTRDVRRVATALVATASLAACGGTDESVAAWQEQEKATLLSDTSTASERASAMGPEVEQALRRAKAQWELAGTGDYTVKVKLSCFCALQPSDNVLVEVRDGQAVRAYGSRDGNVYDVEIDPSRYRDWYTVDGMFGRIEQGLSFADYLEVVYDSDRGFPSLSAFDYTLASADEGEFFKMWDFVADPTE